MHAPGSQSIAGESAVNLLVAFYDIHGRKRAVLFFYFVTGTTQDIYIIIIISLLISIFKTQALHIGAHKKNGRNPPRKSNLLTSYLFQN
jgi:hypothetical protein